jgi:hypothetical protein
MLLAEQGRVRRHLRQSDITLRHLHRPASHASPVRASCPPCACPRVRGDWTGGGVLGLFFVCCLYSVGVIKSAKGAYLDISSSSKH